MATEAELNVATMKDLVAHTTLARDRRIAPTLTRALEVFGDSNKAVDWLASAHPALAGKTPLQILDEGGFETVDTLLMRVAHGIPS